MIKREMYLKRLRDLYDSELIKIIVGVRRSGKSVLLMQIIDELKERGIADDHIIYINFEDYDYINYTDPKQFNKYIKDKIKDKDKYYLLFDEIQEVEDFEKVINSFRATLNVSIFITGSNSKILSGDLATHLTGRYVNIKIMPFTFREYLEFLESEGITKNQEDAFLEYIEWGGMPQVYHANSMNERKLYLRDLYNTAILKDIVERNNINNIQLLNRIIQFIMENIGGIISAKSIADYFKKEKINVSVDTVLNYIEYIINSMIVNKVNRYDIRGKNVMTLLEKYYLADLGILQLKRTTAEEEKSGRLENIVYNELIARGYEVYIGKANNKEVDFVVDDFGKRFYIQVSYVLASEAIIEREFGAFNSILDNYPKYVLSMDKLDFSQNGIIHKNIIDWLLEK